MREATISSHTREYLVLYGRLEDLWDDADRIITRDLGNKESDEFGNLMHDVMSCVQEYISRSISQKLMDSKEREI